jgi:hypothetical protein
VVLFFNHPARKRLPFFFVLTTPLSDPASWGTKPNWRSFTCAAKLWELPNPHPSKHRETLIWESFNLLLLIPS